MEEGQKGTQKVSSKLKCSARTYSITKERHSNNQRAQKSKEEGILEETRRIVPTKGLFQGLSGRFAFVVSLALVF